MNSNNNLKINALFLDNYSLFMTELAIKSNNQTIIIAIQTDFKPIKDYELVWIIFLCFVIYLINSPLIGL